MSKPIATFKPLPWQIKPWQDTSPVVLLTGSAGGGKSRLAAEKIHGFMQRYPNSMGLLLRKTAESLTNSVVLFMQTTVIGHDKHVRHVQSKTRFEYDNGSILSYGGMANEEQREKVRSIGGDGGLDIVWMEEAGRFFEDDFQEIRGRMRGRAAPWRQIILTTNPGRPTSWIYQRLIKGKEASVYYSGAKDNPHNPADYLTSLDSLTGILAARLRDGKWVQEEGVVYEEFNPDLHVIEPFPIPPDWRRYRSIDFGFTNPFVCLWFAEDGDGRLYLYREIYRTQRIVDDHAEQIKSLSRGERFEFTVADHDAEDRATLEKRGVVTRMAQKDISPGIQAVQRRLRKAGDGKPRLFIMRDALVETDRALLQSKRPLCTEDEFAAYTWPKGQDGKALKEAPIKDNDHAMDAVRYMVMALDGAPVTIPIKQDIVQDDSALYIPGLPVYWSIVDEVDAPRVTIIAQIAPSGLRVLSALYERDQPDYGVTLAALDGLGYGEPDLTYIDQHGALQQALFQAGRYHAVRLVPLDDGIKAIRTIAANDRLSIDPRCEELIAELRTYQYNEAPQSAAPGIVALGRLAVKLSYLIDEAASAPITPAETGQADPAMPIVISFNQFMAEFRRIVEQQ